MTDGLNDEEIVDGLRAIDESDEIEDDGDLVDVIVTPKDIENPND